MRSVRAFFPLAALSLAITASAQETISPWRIERNIKAVKDSTLRFKPQIVDTFVERERESSENLPPPIEIRPSAEGNTLPLGGIGDFTRGSRQSLFPGIGATGWTPPDPHIGVGPSQIVQIVNSSVAFFDKATGAKSFQQPINGAGGFFGGLGTTDFVFDPKALYDPVSQRFFIMALELKDDANNKISKVVVAVSDDNNPAGTWYKYRVEAKLTVGADQYWMDYPSYAFNKDGLAINGNMFAMSGSSGWGGIQFIVLPKAPLLTGAPATAFSLRDAGGASGQVAQTRDANVNVIYASSVASTTSFKIYALQNLTGTPTLATTTATVPSFTPLQRDAISTNGRTLWTVDSRLFSVIYRAGKLYISHHVSVSGSDNRNAARWYEFATNNWPASGAPALIQAGSVPGSAGQDTFFPAINVNRAGDISLLFGRSSSSITADMMYAARKKTDPLGVMGTPVVLQSSTNPNYGGPGSNRWGDYFSVQVDPVDDLKFWGVGMVGNDQGNWQTYIQSWTVTSGVGIAYPPISIAPYIGDYVSGALPDVLASDDLYYVMNAVFERGLGQAAGAEAAFQLDQPASNLVSLAIKAEGNAVIKATGMLWLKNWNTGQFEFIKSFPFKSGDVSATAVAGGDLTRFVSPSGEVRAVFRAHVPSKGPVAFPFKIDLIQLQIEWSS